MSVRHGLLALLAEREMYGNQLRQEFEHRTGGTWPLNIGQVYTTLNRLQRDGLVAEGERRPDGSVVYRLTDAGRRDVGEWWLTPVDRTAPARDELAIKLSLAVTAQGVDVAAVVQRQRTETMRAMQDYTRLSARVADPDRGEDLAWLLVLDNLIFATEAEIRWLDHVEQRLARRARSTGAPAGPVTRPAATGRTRERVHSHDAHEDHGDDLERAEGTDHEEATR